ASAKGTVPTRNASLQSFTHTFTKPDAKMPTGNPIETIPITIDRVCDGQISESKVIVMTMTPPTANPPNNLRPTIISQDPANETQIVSTPTEPRHIARDLARPILSEIIPQDIPPIAHPARYSALMYSLISLVWSGMPGVVISLAMTGR